jgi:hypothetical protein
MRGVTARPEGQVPPGANFGRAPSGQPRRRPVITVCQLFSPPPNHLSVLLTLLRRLFVKVLADCWLRPLQVGALLRGFTHQACNSLHTRILTEMCLQPYKVSVAVQTFKRVKALFASVIEMPPSLPVPNRRTAWKQVSAMGFMQRSGWVDSVGSAAAYFSFVTSDRLQHVRLSHGQLL